jgi:hypothetical protein
MASTRGLHLAVFGFAAAICTMTFATTAPTYFDRSDGTAAASTFENVIVISLADFHDQRPAVDMLLPMVKSSRVASDFPAFRPSAVKERTSRSAVRPTAMSGWRSGRFRTLAA